MRVDGVAKRAASSCTCREGRPREEAVREGGCGAWGGVACAKL